MPAARHISRSPSIAFAVIATIRSGRSGQRARMRRVASRPSISGIWTSISTRSYGSRSRRVEDLEAVARDRPRRSPSARAASTASFTFTALSSASRIRSGCVSPSPAPDAAIGVGRAAARRHVRREHGQHGVEQRRRLDGLGELAPRRRRTAARACPTEDRISTGTGVAARLASGVAHRLGQLDAVQLRHVQVEDREVELARRPAPRPGPRAARRCRAATISQRPTCARTIRRFVSLSSTTRTRQPREVGRRPARRPARASGASSAWTTEVERARPRRRRRCSPRRASRPSARPAGG